MPRFIALWTHADDLDAFERHYAEQHMQLVDEWPGLRSATVTRIGGDPLGGDPSYHLVFQAEVEDLGRLRDSDAFARTAADAEEMMDRYGARVTLLTGDEF